MFRRDSLAEAPCEAISDSGIGVGAGFAALGFDVAAEVCWARAIPPLKTQENVMNKPTRITRCIRTDSQASLAPADERVFPVQPHAIMRYGFRHIY